MEQELIMDRGSGRGCDPARGVNGTDVGSGVRRQVRSRLKHRVRLTTNLILPILSHIPSIVQPAKRPSSLDRHAKHFEMDNVLSPHLRARCVCPLSPPCSMLMANQTVAPRLCESIIFSPPSL